MLSEKKKKNLITFVVILLLTANWFGAIPVFNLSLFDCRV